VPFDWNLPFVVSVVQLDPQLASGMAVHESYLSQTPVKVLVDAAHDVVLVAPELNGYWVDGFVAYAFLFRLTSGLTKGETDVVLGCH
jgi:hypothetical protein